MGHEKTRRGGSLDLKNTLFPIFGYKIHELGKHPNSLVINAGTFVENELLVKPLQYFWGMVGCYGAIVD